MNDPAIELPREIIRRESHGSIRYQLPVHRHPQVQLGGAFLLFFGSALLFGVVPKLTGPFPVVLTLGALTFLSGIALVAFGMWACAGHDEIEFAGHTLTRRLRVFCFSWNRH